MLCLCPFERGVLFGELTSTLVHSLLRICVCNFNTRTSRSMRSARNHRASNPIR